MNEDMTDRAVEERTEIDRLRAKVQQLTQDRNYYRDMELSRAAEIIRGDEDRDRLRKELETLRAEVDRLTPRWTDQKPTEEGPRWYREHPDFPIVITLYRGPNTALHAEGYRGTTVADLPGEWSDRPIPPPVKIDSTPLPPEPSSPESPDQP
jgi:hypothetical protein